jgi:serine/threonine protein kinase
VYLAPNKLMGRPEVLKVVSSHLVNRSGVGDRFRAEIRNAAKLHHTNERISNARGADIRADIYSLGCTLHYLLTGGPPFHGASLYDILQAHHSMDAKPLNLAWTSPTGSRKCWRWPAGRSDTGPERRVRGRGRSDRLPKSVGSSCPNRTDWRGA